MGIKNNSTLTIKIKQSELRSYLLLFWLCELFVLTVTRYVLAGVNITEGAFRQTVLWGVAAIPLVVCLFCMKRIGVQKYGAFFAMFFVVIISMLLSLILNPDLVPFFTRETYGIERIFRPDAAIYAFLFFSIMDDIEAVKKNITIYAFLDFIYLIIVDLLPALIRGYWVDVGPSGREMQFTYNLSFGYSMAFPTIVFAYQFLKQHRPAYLVLSLAGLWCVLTQGNRGALLVLVVFCGLMMISNVVGSDNVSKKTLKIMLIVLGLVVVVLFGGLFLESAVNWLSSMGVSSRSLTKLVDGSFSDDNGRDSIWEAVIQAIRSGGLFGYGMLGDRPFVYPLHVVGYSHNLFLELIASYGVIGVGICIYILIDAARMILFCKETLWREVYILLFSISFQLMLSMSFWYVWQFWAAAAIAYKHRKLYGTKLMGKKRIRVRRSV